jgi:hypothetical protein
LGIQDKTTVICAALITNGSSVKGGVKNATIKGHFLSTGEKHLPIWKDNGALDPNLFPVERMLGRPPSSCVTVGIERDDWNDVSTN